VFDIEARALDRHENRAPGDGVSCPRSRDRSRSGCLAGATDPQKPGRLNTSVNAPASMGLAIPGATADVRLESAAPAPPRPRKETHDVPDIVLVDDDDHYREALSADLEDRGFAVSCFADGPSFLEAMSKGVEAEVALLDWVLPEMSGVELLGALREQGIELPVVFLTGYSEAERELQALHRGAVDFVDKARGTEVLAHRLRLIIKGQHQAPADMQPLVERHGNLALQRSTARALWLERDVGLTMTEYKIVLQLVSRKGQPQTYRAIYDTAHYEGFIAGSGDDGHNSNVRSLVKRIRKKFRAIDPGFSEIENLAGVGYRWAGRPKL
jgi:two-component system, OmpR family, response regulator ChvI